MWPVSSNYTQNFSKIELKKYVLISSSKNPKKNYPLLAQERAMIPIIVNQIPK